MNLFLLSVSNFIIGWEISFAYFIFEVLFSGHRHVFCRFLAQTGLVSVETQMQDLNLVPNDQTEKEKVR